MGEMPSAPPPYSPSPNDDNKPRRRTVDPEKGELEDDEENEKKGASEDTLHFLDHDRDSITSLSFRYGVPAAALRRANNITSDHLLSGRKAISIPGRYYKGGISLSPRPILGEEEELRRAKIRRFMTSCKVSDYDAAVLYLEQSGYSLDESVEAYLEDEAWERDHVRGSVPHKGSTAQNRGPFWRGLSRRV
ncbi:hypothetical protein AAL_00375 [Moelleriella libera RCEF 2490]|uniref:LysM domain-containing protein n=1 Tax=Moelleriella libera RCEF 2490 TaxID=1081109 RepID=A0A166USM9_9HYPO|nr:hypothetical protein AAL_00375 [Moelleriella libera RCEF 2490]